MSLNTTPWLSFLRTRPVFEAADEGAGGSTNDGETNTGDDGAAGDDGVVLGGDATKGDDAQNQDGARDGDVALDGGTAEGQDNSDGDGEGDNDSAKDGDGEDGDDTIPEEYVFENLPEGIEVDEDLAGEVSPVFKELGLNQEKADKLVAAYAKVMQTRAEAAAEEVGKLLGGWKKAAQADKEIGLDNWKQSTETANALIRKFGTPELINDVLVGQGMGNHPEIIRFFARIGSQFNEDQLVTGETTDTSDPVAQEVSWYGETTPTTKKG